MSSLTSPPPGENSAGSVLALKPFGGLGCDLECSAADAPVTVYFDRRVCLWAFPHQTGEITCVTSISGHSTVSFLHVRSVCVFAVGTVTCVHAVPLLS